jgi:hypothetical protein
MTDAAWLFGRSAERLRLERRAENGSQLLFITVGDDPPRRLEFNDAEALIRFQSDMEQLLVHTGWMLLLFEPERRTGRDRRLFPRIRERRRWWTG